MTPPIKTKAIQIGGSVFLKISPFMKKQYDIMAGDYVSFSDLKVFKIKIRKYVCLKDNHVFETSDDEPYCPVCGRKDCIERIDNLKDKPKMIYTDKDKNCMI